MRKNLILSENINKILEKLRDIFPQYNISIGVISDTRVNIYCDGIKINEFNPTLFEKEFEFLKDRVDYIDLVLQLIKEPIDAYHQKKMIKSVGLKSGYKVVTLQRLKEALNNSKSNAEAARYLNIGYQTFKKYALLYKDERGVTFFEKHKNRGRKGVPTKNKKYENIFLSKILNNEGPLDYPNKKLKCRLIKNGYIDERCERCGFEERRVLDYKVPLLLDFIDGNNKNRQLNNLRLLCYNCYFLNAGGDVESSGLELKWTIKKIKGKRCKGINRHGFLCGSFIKGPEDYCSFHINQKVI